MTVPSVDVQIWAEKGSRPSVTVTAHVTQGADQAVLAALSVLARKAFAALESHVLEMADHAAEKAGVPAPDEGVAVDDAPDLPGFDPKKCPDHPDLTKQSTKGPGYYCKGGTREVHWSTTIFKEPPPPRKKWKLDGRWLERDEYIAALQAPRTGAGEAVHQGGDEW